MRGDSDRKVGLFFMVFGLVVWIGLSALAIHVFLDPGEVRPNSFLFQLGDRESRLAALSTDVTENRMRLLWGLGMAGLFPVPVLLFGLLGSVLSTHARRMSPSAVDLEVGRRIHLLGWGLCVFGLLLGLLAGGGMLRIFLYPGWIQQQAEFLGRGSAEAYRLAVTRALDSGLTVFVPFALFSMFVFYVAKRLHREQLELLLYSGAASSPDGIEIVLK